MNVEEYMSKHNLTDADVDTMAQPYEQGTYKSENNHVYHGSHLDAVGKNV